MNWNLFWAVLGLGLAAALLNLRRELTPPEAWLLVTSRIVAGGLLAWLLPEQFNGIAVAALVVSETATAVAGMALYLTRRILTWREGRRWQRLWQQAETSRCASSRIPDTT
jgi:hypothetical protein